MTDQVSSQFSISSTTVDAACLSLYFSWPITEAVTPETMDQHITVFDLGVGQHQRVDSHLEAVKQALLKKESELSKLMEECHFSLWVNYRFPAREGGFNLSSALLAAFAFLQVAIIFQLNET